MDTIYYNLRTRRVKVSGGADLLTFVPTPIPTPQPHQAQVQDFDRCRRHLETKAARRPLNQTVQATPESAPEPEPQQSPRSRQERTANWLELGASAAVILLCLAAAAAFFLAV